MLKLNSLGITIEPPSGPFPFGRLINSNPLGSGTGTPVVEEWANDPVQMVYAVADHFGITVSDVAEQVGDSDLVRLFQAVLPVGTFLPAAFTTDPATLDIRCLPCEGQTVSEVTYAELFARIGTFFNTGGEPGGSFRLPETRGEGIRGFDNGRGIDTGRVFGSYQLDEFQGHLFYNGYAAGAAGNADIYGITVNDIPGLATSRISESVGGAAEQALTSLPKTDGVNGTPRTGLETRIRNFTARFLIRY